MFARTVVISLVLLLVPNVLWGAASVELYDKGNYDKAFREAYLNITARKNESSADYLILGKLFLNGHGAAERDITLGQKYLSKAAQMGNIPAMLYLAEQYYLGTIIEKNIPSSIKLYEMAKSAGAGNLETIIASLANELSSGELTAASCSSAIDAATAENAEFYIYAAKCLNKESKSRDQAILWLTHKIKNGSAEEVFEAASILGDKDSFSFSPFLVANLILSRDFQQEQSGDQAERFEVLVSNLTFEPEDCKLALQSENVPLVKTVCNFVIENGSSDQVLDIDSFYEMSNDSGFEVLSARVNLLTKIVASSTEAAIRLQKIAKNIATRGTLNEATLLLRVYLSNRQFLERTHETAAILFVRASQFEDFDGTPLLNELMSHTIDNGSAADLENVFATLANDAKTNVALKNFLKQAIEFAYMSQSEKASNVSTGFFVENAKNVFSERELFEFSYKLLGAGSKFSSAHNNLKLFVIESDRKKLATIKGQTEKIVSHSIASKRLGNCQIVQDILRVENFSTALNVIRATASQNSSCLIGDLGIVFSAFEGFPNRSTSAAQASLKQLCAETILNACYALGVSYQVNFDGTLSPKEADEMAAMTLEKNFERGHKRSALALAENYATRGKKELAQKMAQTAYKFGFLDALYIEAEIGLKKIFSGKKACKPLMMFLAEANESSKYWDKAVQLKSKKCKN